MTCATMLNVIRDNVTETELEASIDLARASDSHLSLLLVSLAPVPPIGAHMEAVSLSWLKERQADEQALAARSLAIDAFMTRHGISFDVDEAYTEIFHLDNVIGQKARTADLVILGSDVLADPTTRDAVLDGVLFHARTPVILDPFRHVKWRGNRILIAWADTPEAAAAVRAAVPLLKLAQEVTVGVVDAPLNDQQVGDESIAYLSRIGVKAAVIRIDGRGLDVADVLRDEALRLNADLIVMGAYGHNRFRQRIFGGTTRSMIRKPGLPLLLGR